MTESNIVIPNKDTFCVRAYIRSGDLVTVHNVTKSSGVSGVISVDIKPSFHIQLDTEEDAIDLMHDLRLSE